MDNDIDFTGFKLVPNTDLRSKKATPFDRKADKPWYLGKLRYKGYWRSYHFIDRDRGFYSTSLSHLAGYLKANNTSSRDIFLDAGCGDSPDALMAATKLGYKKAFKIDLFEPTFDEYGCVKQYSYEPIKDRMRLLEKKNKVSFIKADLCEPLPIHGVDKSIDAISCNAVVDLIKEEDKIAFYKNMYRILKPGGLLCICFVPLAAGYGSFGYLEHDIATMPVWGVNFESIASTSSVFIVRKPMWERARDKNGRFLGKGL